MNDSIGNGIIEECEVCHSRMSKLTSYRSRSVNNFIEESLEYNEDVPSTVPLTKLKDFK